MRTILACAALLTIAPAQAMPTRPFDAVPFITDTIPEPVGDIVYECRAMIVIDRRDLPSREPFGG